MTRALASFSVSHNGLRVKVRVLNTIADVHRAYTAGGRPRYLWGKSVHAYFQPSASPTAKHVGTIVLPADGNLHELVPHEVVHAAMHHLAPSCTTLNCTGDEPLATAVGLLSVRIFARLRRLGIAS